MKAIPPDSRAWEKFHQAIRVLATRRGGLRTRVRHAFDWDALRALRPDDLPYDLEDEFVALRDQADRILHSMSEDEARALAEKIIDLHDKICRRMDWR